ncbi:MAG: SDR family oxidoreductase [bacterium]
MNNYLITGGAGFIGSNIVEELVNQGQKVKVLDDFSTGKKENLKQFSSAIEIIEGDIRNVNIVTQAMKGIDYVLHQAALASIPRSIKEPLRCNDVNVNGTLNVLLASREAGVKRVVYASSSSVYGDNPALPKVEEMNPKPKAPYPAAKLAGEWYCRIFSKVYGLETVCLRYFNVFGPRQDPKSEYAAVIPKFIELMLKEKPPVIFGDGTQSRDFTFVKNVVHANLLAVQKKGISGKVFNIACGNRHTLLELVRILNEIMKKNITPVFLAERAADIKHSLAEINKAGEAFGYRPVIDFAEGLQKTIEYYSRKEG